MLTPDDPRITAAALGELTPEEQAEFDRELAALEAPLRAEIENALKETGILGGRIREARQAELRELAAEKQPTAAGRITAQAIAQVLAAAGDETTTDETNTDGTPPNTQVANSQITTAASREMNMRKPNRAMAWVAGIIVTAASLVAAWAMLPGMLGNNEGEVAHRSAENADGAKSESKSADSAPDDSISSSRGMFEAENNAGSRAPLPSTASTFNDERPFQSFGRPGGADLPNESTTADSASVRNINGVGGDGAGEIGGNFGGGLGGGGLGGGGLGGALPPGGAQGNAAGPGAGATGGQGSSTAGDDGANPPGNQDQSGNQADGQESQDANDSKTETATTPASNAPTWKRSPITPNATRLKVGDDTELPLEGMQANVQIDGFRARVLLDLYFYSTESQQREADFRLRLPPEASLYYFAFGETVYSSPTELTQVLDGSPAFFNVERARELSLDPKRVMADRGQSWINPKEARVVQKEKAAYAYGETVRRSVDPALVEWAGSGIFSAKVFPVQPGKMHRIVVGYDVNLTQMRGESGLADLVYQFAAPYAKQVVLDVRVAELPGVDVSVSPEVEAFTDDVQLHFRVENPEQIVEVRQHDPGDVLLVGDDPQAGSFFSGRFSPQLPAADEVTTPRDAIFLVDTSLSANPDRFNTYLKLLEAVLKENRETMPNFAVLFFNAHSHWWKEGFAKNTDENVAALLQHTQTLALEGATDLANAAAEAVHPGWLEESKTPRFDYFLLSDGAITWGERDIRAVAATFELRDGPLFAYTAGMVGDDVRALSVLTQATGGAVFSIVAEDQIATVATAHRGRPWELINATMQGAEDILLAGNPQTVYPGTTLSVVGRGKPAEEAVLDLLLRRDGEERTVSVPFGDVLQSELAPRNYGQVAVAGLEELVAQTEEMATAYARHFRITGQTCSLLMLETEADYERFEIRPEDDAFVVRQTDAATLIADAKASLADRQSSSKADFIAWMERLGKMPGMEFEIPVAMKLMLDDLPEGAFQVRPRPLEPQWITWDQLPVQFQEVELTADEIGYEAVMAEAARRREEAGADDALHALSSLVESYPGDHVLSRDVAYSALEYGRSDQAFPLFRQVALARPYEPQTYHALARCAEDMGNADLAMLYYEVCVRGGWEGRFGEFRQIAGLDYLRLLRSIADGKTKVSSPDFAEGRLETATTEFGLGLPELVVTMAWNTDNTDVDLHVIDPSGEECYYSHTDTRIGGHITTDVTTGYGPEMFYVRKAVPGPFRISANYFSTDANRAGTRTRVFVRVYQNWGTPEEAVTSHSVLLKRGEEKHDVATVTVK